MENFGEYIQKCRESRCYKLREFAEVIEISPYYLSMIENGKKSNPKIQIIGRIYKALKLSKSEMEKLLYLYAKANDTVCSDIVDYIMEIEPIFKFYAININATNGVNAPFKRYKITHKI